MASISGSVMPPASERQVILLNNRTIGAVSLLLLCGLPHIWSITALNHNIGHVGGERLLNFAGGDAKRIGHYLFQEHPVWYAKVKEISTRLKKGDASKYKEVKKAAVFIWCGGLHHITFHNHSLTCGQLLGVMNAIIEAACFFFGGPEHRPVTENAVAVSQCIDRYNVSRWRATDGCATYDAVFPVKDVYEEDLDISRESLLQLSLPFPLTVLPERTFTDIDGHLVSPWKLIDVFSAPFVGGYIPILPLRHKRPADGEMPHGAKATGELLLPLYYSPPTGPLLLFNIYKYLIYEGSSSDEDDFLSKQLAVLSEQHEALSRYLYALSNKIYNSPEQLSCLTMHFRYMSKSMLYSKVYDLYSRSYNLRRKLIDPSALLNDKVQQLNDFWNQYKSVSKQYEDIKKQFDEPFPQHDCDVCAHRSEFPQFPSPLSYDKLLGCGERVLPMDIRPWESYSRGYCLTPDQLEKLMRSISTDPSTQGTETVVEEQLDKTTTSMTTAAHSREADTRMEEQVEEQVEEQIDKPVLSMDTDSDLREADAQFLVQVDQPVLSIETDPDPRETHAPSEEQGSQPVEKKTILSESQAIDNEIIDYFTNRVAEDDALLAEGMSYAESVGPPGQLPELPPGYTSLADSATVTYERATTPATTSGCPAKRCNRAKGEPFSATESVGEVAQKVITQDSSNFRGI